MALPDLLRRAEDIRNLARNPGWELILDVVGSWETLNLQRLLNETTKAEDISRLRGLLTGLASAREAAASIVAYAEEAEAKANERVHAQEPQHV